jgi:hypothetical protein
MNAYIANFCFFPVPSASVGMVKPAEQNEKVMKNVDISSDRKAILHS